MTPGDVLIWPVAWWIGKRLLKASVVLLPAERREADRYVTLKAEWMDLWRQRL